MDTPKDEDTPKDSAAKQGFHQGYADDMEGHRSHTVYVGVHLPGTQRPPRHRRQQSQPGGADSASDEDGDDEDERPITPPAQRVQFILGEDADNGAHTSHPLFSEMEELVQKGNDIEWKETARWVKFEEDVEEGGNRWSKPHVATLSLHSLFELRSMLLNGAVMLDLEAASLEQVANLLLDHMAATSMLAPELRDKASAPSAASPLPCVQRALRHV